ncbi:ABC-F family ATP-binding cassette domain-containing protein [Geitlerinema calcuttense]|uniref:ABC-F family ATP-binding cassette domain-containing protein n=1 Tax=Geitlerinema calcuttense NRMC-F 0142 TaxID=2922238 RepID=A0ABT7LXX8_9CYAN|nr:ABC-F family ATP-binding cassette domain-containing protein [Geitlerinema calcuttense]MDL5056876.1 ABC-F family ATP-binding cassette domain-containing protein [Geitlerinema calcuttense NRMC-F 0142]
MPQSPYLSAFGLTYELPGDRTLFQNVQLGLAEGDRVALVGANGVGKSTLLKILAGNIEPSRGSVQRHCPLYYLPQISTLHPQIKGDRVQDFLFSLSDEWWHISEILETQFNTVLDWSLSLDRLSGGELTKLFLAIGLAQHPKVLLLDEPTNHLDYLALEELSQFLQQFVGAFAIVSHKPFFLDRVVETTWELTPDGVNLYGGNFSLYREQKHSRLSARWRSHEVAKKELKRAKTSAQQESQRAAQSRRNGRHQAGSMPKILAGGLKRKAEVTAGKLKQKHAAAIADATQKVTQTKVRTQKATSIQLESTHPQHKNLIAIQGANLWVGDRLLIENIQFHLAFGERVAIAGTNGSGKSCLAQAILNREGTPAFLESGEILLSPTLKVVYLDQTYEWVNRDFTILENMQAANPDLEYQLLRQQLGHFLFFNDEVHKPASVLSGGELARLALAMLGIAQIDLLILDEPTNNLDIPTVEQMVEAVNEYQGGLWVISHDLDYVRRIQITDSYHVHLRSLQRTQYLPDSSQEYYEELRQRTAFNNIAG